MGIIYGNENENGKRGYFPRIDDFDATRMYMKHYSNLLFLQFLANNGNTLEKIQAGKEMEIAERKMKFWKNQGNFDGKEAESLMMEEKKKWRGK